MFNLQLPKLKHHGLVEVELRALEPHAFTEQLNNLDSLVDPFCEGKQFELELIEGLRSHAEAEESLLGRDELVQVFKRLNS